MICQVDNRLLDEPMTNNISELDILFHGHASVSRLSDESFNGGGRIVGGSTVSSPDKWPFFVQLNGGACAGALIGKHFVLTSAQCCEITELKYVLFGRVAQANTALSGIWGREIHPNYNKETKHDNLCLIHYSAEIEYGMIMIFKKYFNQ